MSPRDTFKYAVELDGAVIDHGVTDDLVRRSDDLRTRWPYAALRQVGRRTTRQAALRWLAREWAHRQQGLWP